MGASQRGHAAILIALLDGGADRRATDKDNMTVLLNPVFLRRDGAVRVLLERGAPVNEAFKRDGLTTLMLAADSGYAQTVEALLAGSADVKCQGPQGFNRKDQGCFTRPCCRRRDIAGQWC